MMFFFDSDGVVRLFPVFRLVRENLFFFFFFFFFFSYLKCNNTNQGRRF